MAETSAPADVFEKARTHDRAEQLAAAKEADLLPYFRVLESAAGPVVEMEGGYEAGVMNALPVGSAA